MTTAEDPRAPEPSSVTESKDRASTVTDLKDRARKLKAALRRVRDRKQEVERELRKALVQSERDFLFRRNRQRRLNIVDQPLILISQIQRSGGTLLSQLLDGHPECYAHPYELKWGRPAKWDWPQVDLAVDGRAQYEALDENWVKVFAALGLYEKSEGRVTLDDDDAMTGGHLRHLKKGSILTRRDRRESLDDSLDSAHPFIFDRSLQRLLFEDLVTGPRPVRQRQLLDAYLTAFFGAWLDYQNQYCRPKRFVTAFVPRVHMQGESLDRFFVDYPDGFLVSLIRHPAAWYASATKHADPQYANRGAAIDLWLDSTRASAAAADRNDNRVIVVIFEELVAHTDQVMQRICDRVGLTYHDTLTRPTFNGMPIASNSHFVRSTQVDPEVTERYRSTLSAEDLSAIETRALPSYAAACAKFGLASG